MGGISSRSRRCTKNMVINLSVAIQHRVGRRGGGILSDTDLHRSDCASQPKRVVNPRPRCLQWDLCHREYETYGTLRRFLGWPKLRSNWPHRDDSNTLLTSPGLAFYYGRPRSTSKEKETLRAVLLTSGCLAPWTSNSRVGRKTRRSSRHVERIKHSHSSRSCIFCTRRWHYP